jgi:hypothetical protein
MANETEPKKKPREPMPRDMLEQHLVEFLKTHNLCVLATARDNVPRAVSLEYEPEGTALYILLDSAGTRENIKLNPQISAVIHDPLHGWETLKGIQLTARARLVNEDNVEYPIAWRIFNRANAGNEGWDVPPEGRTLLIIEPQKIELFETALRHRGYKVRQVWEAQN